MLRKEKLVYKGLKVRKIQMMIFMITFYRERRSFMFYLVVLNFHKRFTRTLQPLTVWCLWEIKSQLKMASRNQVVGKCGGCQDLPHYIFPCHCIRISNLIT